MAEAAMTNTANSVPLNMVGEIAGSHIREGILGNYDHCEDQCQQPTPANVLFWRLIACS